MGLVELLLGVVFASCLAVGLGLGAMGDAGSAEFIAAKDAFLVGALAVGIAYWVWWRENDRPLSHVISLGAAAGLWIFLALPIQMEWLDGREAKIKALEAAVHQTPPAKNDQLDAVFASNPSLLSLFMGAFSNADLKVSGFIDVTEKDLVGRIYYNILGSFNSNTKFIAYYLPHSNNTLQFMKYLKDASIDVINSVDGTINLRTKNALNTSSVNLKDFLFSRTVHIFYEDDVLDLKTMSDLTELYKADKQLVQFHSMEYKFRVWDEIKLGRLPNVREYEIRDGLIQPAHQS